MHELPDVPWSLRELLHLRTVTQRSVGWEGPRAMPPGHSPPTRGSRAWAEVTCHEGHRFPPTHVCSHYAPPPAPTRVCPHRAPPPRPPGSALTVCPPSRLKVRLFRQVSLSVRPHLRNSASTVKALLSQGCRHECSHSAQGPQPPASPPPAWLPMGLVPGAGAFSQGGLRGSRCTQPRQGLPCDSRSVPARTPGPVPWPTRSCSLRALCTASHRTWRSGRPPALSRCQDMAPPGSSTGRWSRCWVRVETT